MKSNFPSMFLGIGLILIGGIALANQFGHPAAFSTFSWVLIFAAASAFFLITYFLNGLRTWGWLFPTSIFAALSGTLLITSLHDASLWIPTLIIGSVALPFIAAFLLDRSRIWALIPAFVLSMIAFLPILGQVLGGANMGAFLLAVMGLPFVVAYLVPPRAWWGIIPGGLLLSIGGMLFLENSAARGFSLPVMFIGWMVTFGLVWLRQGSRAMDWAKYPTIVMGILAGIMACVSFGLETYWAAAGLILVGVALVGLSLRPRNTPTFE